MLITKDQNNRHRSIYKCDMCNKVIKIDELNKVHIEKPYICKKKYWDLCNRCLDKLVNSIKKYRKKMEDK